MSKMSFLRDMVSGFLRRKISEYPPLQVVEVKPEDYVHYEIHHREDSLLLYATEENTTFEVVLHYLKTAFSICRCGTLDESTIHFNRLADKLPIVMSQCPSQMNVDSLQEIFNYIREHPNQTLAHLSAHFGFLECFKLPQLTQAEILNGKCPDTGMTPLHIAIRSGKLPTVLTLLSLGTKLDIKDIENNNVLHFAASTSKEIINTICSHAQNTEVNLLTLINTNNNENYSPLHLACLYDKPECVKELLRNGAYVNGASIIDRGHRDLSCEFNKEVMDQLETKDMKNGGTPLHWAKSPQCLEALIEMGCNVGAKNFQGETVLHIMVGRQKMLPCIITLLSHGAEVNAIGINGNTPLHIAVKSGDVTIVQALIVFGANVNITNASGETPRHLAATTKRNPQQDMILYVLHSVGARRCSLIRPNCNDGCSQSNSSHFNGIPPENSPFNRSEKFYDQLLGESLIKKTIEKKKSFLLKASNCMDIDRVETSPKPCRLLCLDGGGIRGLILIQMLWVLEELMQKRITECFDFLAGTSTGGILALALAMGHSAHECRQLYFKLKDKVFIGGRPYESENLENFLKKLLGEESRMSDILKPRVMVTATVADKFPPVLQLFRNYESSSEVLGMSSFPNPSPKDQPIWKAARSSGAAPTYFRPMGGFLDGGLISNNPTLDAISEIHSINKALEATGREIEKTPIDLVVSLGTGAVPISNVQIVDVYRPDSLFGVAKIAFMASSLGQLLVEQASQANGQVVERAKAWCSMIDVPFFRLNPPLSEDIPLDETNNVRLVNMLWETTAYMYSRKEEIDELILLLT